MNKTKPPLINGLNITEHEASTYRKNYIEFYETKKLTKPIIPIIGISAPYKCNYNCVYCSNYSKEQIISELNEEDIEKILTVGKKLGVKTIEIAGAGEPTLWHNLKFLVSKAHEYDYTILIFTNNSIISQDNDLLEFFYENNVSLILKYHSHQQYIHNFLTGRNDANEHKEKAIKNAMKLGFTKDDPTRLGIETVISSLNIEELPELWRFARNNNLFPFFETIHHIGRAKIGSLDIPYDEMARLFKYIRQLDADEYGYLWKPKPPYLGFECTVSEHIHIDENGNVSPCFEFSTNEGNIRDEELISILKRSKRLYEIRKLKEQSRDITCRDT